MDSLNRMAIELVDEAIDFADELQIDVHELSNGATVLDFGVTADGGIETGLFLAEIQTAGLATVQTDMKTLGESPLTHVEIQTDHPVLALLGSQKAGWELSIEGFEALGSGPARAMIGEEQVFATLDYTEDFDLTVLVLETEILPSESVASHIANRVNVDPSSVFLPAFSTASITGSVNMASRAAELAVFRLQELGYPIEDIRSVSGSAPVAPVPDTEETALARTIDAIAYGSQVHLIVDMDHESLSKLPSSASTEYGEPFANIFAEADWDFYDIPESVFAPAQVTIDVIGGTTYTLGNLDPEILMESFRL
ncbi:MAG: methenyltetrahydromethanopterin cyclohydrolase [Halobacteriaceae archaeon]